MTFEEYWNIQNTQNNPDYLVLIDPKHAAKIAWDNAIIVERNRCKEKCEELANDNEAPYKDYEDTYLNGWLDACNECTRVISGCLPRSVVFTQEELSKVASIGKAYFEQNRPMMNMADLDNPEKSSTLAFYLKNNPIDKP